MNGAKKKSKEKFKKCIKTNENGNTTYQSPQDTAKAAERKVFNDKCIYEEIRKI